MSAHSSVSQAAFEEKYRRTTDPWRFADSRYERHRYDLTLRWLMRAHYQRAFEPACSIGVLTSLLAERCGEVQAIDIAPSAVAMARERCANLQRVSISCADVATECPQGPFDLVVFSELGYYFSTTELTDVVQALSAQLEVGGELIGVHWLGHSEDHVLHGDEVHATLRDALAESCTWIKGARQPEFRLDTWRRK